MARIALDDENAITQFEDGIRALVNAGHGARAMAMVHRAALDNGLDELARLIDPKTLDPVIDPPGQLLRECAEFAGLAGNGGALCLSLHCESLSAPTERQGLIRRKAEHPPAQDLLGWQSDNAANPLHLKGLEAVFALVRQPSGETPNSPGRVLRHKLALWAIAGSFVKAVKAALGDAALPAQLTLELRDHRTPRSMEEGFVDLLPAFRTIITPRSSHDPTAIEQIRQERKAANLARFQNDWIRIVAETRETHRLIRYFPFYRAASRQKLAETWQGSLAISCSAAGINPKPEISWRMSGDELTAILRRVLEGKGIPDVEDALDPAHTDALHEHELAAAKAADFAFAPALSMFALNLAYAIKVGGPFVEDRWVHAKPYAQEMKLRR
jgi:hypothetical protein